jgi:osmoprotectant transport system ATP-binding protein
VPAAPHDSAIIRLEGVTKRYSAQSAPALHDLSCTIPRGELVAIVGGSGSGKTTTLKCINRLIEPDRGEVYIEDEPVRALAGPVLRRRIGYVFQGVGLFPHLTVAENIGMTPALLGWEKRAIAERVAELLALVELPGEYALRSATALSGGQRQRVGLARALAARPRIVLMDEPFGALDPLTRDSLGSAYRKLHEQMQLTTVMVTHDILEAVLLADRILVMRAGEIVADGTPRALLHDHADPSVRSLMDMPRAQAARVNALIDG